MWLNPVDAISLAEKITGTKSRDWIAWLRGIYRLATIGRMQIFIVGCGGTGKTSLRQFLLTRDVEKVPGRHQATTTRERETAERLEALSHVYDYPGQANRFDKEFERDATTFNSSYRTIVVMCCAYGYHTDWGRGGSLGEQPKAISQHTTNMEEAIADCRRAELEFTRDFLQKHVRNAKRVDMLTLVMKQDLWFGEQEEVANFYGKQYVEIIDDFEKNRNNFTHDIYPCCLRREDFESKLGQLSEVHHSQSGFTATLEHSYRKVALDGLEDLVRRSQG